MTMAGLGMAATGCMRVHEGPVSHGASTEGKTFPAGFPLGIACGNLVRCKLQSCDQWLEFQGPVVNITCSVSL